MKAMVLCAGMGSRLGDLTRKTPKPLLTIGSRSILEHILSNLRQHGFTDVAINLHFEADQIRTALGDGGALGLRISFSFENQLLGTAGATKNMQGFFSGEKTCLIHYGDVLTNEDFSAMREFHEQKQALATVLVHERVRSNSAMTLDKDQRIIEFWERPDAKFWKTTRSTWVNSGILLVSTEVLDWIPENTFWDWPRDVFPELVSSGRMYAYPLRGYRTAVDSPERLEQARRDVAAGCLERK
jgi:NDP-sugar pyrophosphorylase family protein